MRNLQNLAVVSSLAISSLAAAQNAVEWRVADGGNGHWYRFVSGPVDCFAGWQANAESSGAHLVSIGSVSEQTFLGGLLPGATGGFVGGTRSPESDANLGWTWVTGEPFSPMAVSWAPRNPGCCAPNEFWLRLLNNGLHDGAECENGTAAFFEWSADCNNDGLVDYGQILAGELADANHNNIPDCCEGGASCNPCPGDVDNSGAVNGVDLAAILNSWGTSGGKYPGADVNHDSVVNGSDLAIVLNGWGPCP